MFCVRTLFLLGCFAVLLPLPTFAESAPERSVVKIINYAQAPDRAEPWRYGRVRGGMGSGFVIEGNRIMTNAHVVSWSKQILVHRYQDPQPYRAEVAFIGHDCDLAVLTVEDPAFFEGLSALPIGDLPEVRSGVTTYGYPTGGRQISYTRGVISRIEIQRYVQVYNRSLLAVQTDAAINPGNSGGPVIQDGKVVGVSFQGKPGLENAGFFIPPEVLRHFLEDIEDGRYDGFPDAGLGFADLHNPAFRRALGLPEEGDGVRIDRIFYPFPETHRLLQVNDVVLEVEGYPVGSDGTVLYRGNRVHAAVLFDQVQDGEPIRMKVWREGEALDVELPLFVNHADRTAGKQYVPPPYCIVGGLVFTELSLDYLSALGRNWRKKVSPEIVHALFLRNRLGAEEARARPVVLSKILKHPVNVDFAVGQRSVLTEVNGAAVDSMEALVAALDSNDAAFHRFSFLSGREEALPRSEAEAATAALLQSYNIPAARRLASEPDDSPHRAPTTAANNTPTRPRSPTSH